MWTEETIRKAAEKYVLDEWLDEWLDEYETLFEDAFIAGAYFIINNTQTV